MRPALDPPCSDKARFRGFALFLLATLLLSPGWPTSVLARGEESAAAEELDALEQRLLELLASLPPEQREAARERLLAALSEPLEDAEIGSEPAEEPAVDAALPTPPTDVGPAAEPPPPAPPPPKPRRRPDCRTLEPFDENGDGKINARDRHWRHLYLWIDKNGDGRSEERELESAYEAGVREIAIELDVFYRRKGSLGEIRRGRYLLFDVRGDGFGGARKVDDGALAVDADALRRSDGPNLLKGDGSPVKGIQPFEPDWRLDQGGGETLSLECPGQ